MTIPVFLANPDSYGRFGHQTLRIIASLLFARLMDGYFVPVKYSYFSYHWNNYVDFSRSSLAVRLIAGVISYNEVADIPLDPSGNTKLNLMKADQLGELMAATSLLLRDSEADYALIRLPFDQSPGRLLALLSTFDRNELCQIFHFRNIDNLQDSNDGRPYCVIHIRRGDVNPMNHPGWFIPDKVYLQLLEFMDSVVPEQFQIIVLTQGASMLINEPLILNMRRRGRLQVIDSENSFRTSNEVYCFKLMIGASLLVGGLSSFSYLASLVSGKPFVCVTNSGVLPAEWPPCTYQLVEIVDGCLAIGQLPLCLFASLNHIQ
jgi:hypothetical protein